MLTIDISRPASDDRRQEASRQIGLPFSIRKSTQRTSPLPYYKIDPKEH